MVFVTTLCTKYLLLNNINLYKVGLRTACMRKSGETPTYEKRTYMLVWKNGNTVNHILMSFPYCKIYGRTTMMCTNLRLVNQSFHVHLFLKSYRENLVQDIIFCISFDYIS